MTPEQVAIEYVELDAKTLDAPAAPDEAERRRRRLALAARVIEEERIEIREDGLGPARGRGGFQEHGAESLSRR